MAVETLVTTNLVVLAGETRCAQEISPARLEELARAAIKDIGYDQDNFHWEKSDVKVYVHPQSVDIAQGVDALGNKDEGAR